MNRKYWHALYVVLTILCLAIVTCQVVKCWNRYMEIPKLTEVSIRHASKYPRPEVTFCMADYEKYNQTLYHCKIE